MLSDYPQYAASIHHDGSSRYVLTTSPTLRLGDEVTIRLRTAPGVPVTRLLLRTCPDGEQHFSEMIPVATEPACQWWQATLRMHMPLVGYRFLIFSQDGIWWYNGRGLQRHTPTDNDDFRLVTGYSSPAWLGEAVFYQIFPDRFSDGDPTNNITPGAFTYHGQPVLTRRWGEPPARHGLQAMLEFYGGDLAGIEQHLDYLDDLGVNALYLNPIFTAYSNHRYDVADYENVDPHLGGNQALVSLRQRLSQRGYHLLLDIVPNHCGIGHAWFQAALADPNAPSAEYFTFHSHPDDYECWLGVRSLPKLNYRSAALRQAMIGAPDAVFRRWLRRPYAIDGWRIDVANMLARQGESQMGLEIGRTIRQAVKEENPDAYLLGENFYDASAQLQGDCWDGVMNYSGFTMPLWNWLGRSHMYVWPERVKVETPWSTQALVDTWEASRANIPWALARQQFNLLGSHDTTRILTLLEGDTARNRLAAALLLTYPGVPSIYYGDEIGLQGDGESVRGCMPWDQSAWDHEQRAFVQHLIHLRRTSPALRQGGFQVLLVEADTLAYMRDSAEEQIILVGNRGPGVRPHGPLPVWPAAIPDGAELVELFSGHRAVVSQGVLALPALPPGVMLWRRLP